MKTENTPEETNQPTPFLKRGWVKNSLTIVLFIAVFLAIRPFMQGDVAEGQAPVFKAESITGKTIDLAEYRGAPVMVHFWATWCPICELERDGIESVAKDYPVINVATQSNDDDALLEYAKQHGMNPDIIVNDFDGVLMKAYGARAVPASFILDGKGNIQFVEVGYTTSYGFKLRLWWLD